MSHFLKRTLNLTSQEKLAGGTSDQAQEASAGHPQTATAAPPSARVVKNFLSMMDVEGPSRGGGSRRMEHGAPRLRQLLGSGPLAADAVAAS
jgi:plant G-box-binding factor